MGSMKAYNIVEDRIMLRDHRGDLFEFKLVASGRQGDTGPAARTPSLRLVGLPAWRDGVTPRNAEARIDFARISARDIARQHRMFG